MNSSIISTKEELKELCGSIKRGDVIAFDIEFMRYKTFYPILCLIQINFKNKLYAIDAISDKMDLKPFIKILKKRSVIKILHSANQDLSVLNNCLGVKPRSIVDTQMMANFLDLGFNISYANLVKEMLNEDISKEEQRSDWKKRPLSNSQLEYALNDVRYLPDIYQNLFKQLEEGDKLKFFLQEMKITLKKDYDINNQDLFKKFSFRNNNSDYENNIKKLVIWRDIEAKKRDIPRSFILKDEILAEISKKTPKNKDNLRRILLEFNVKSSKFEKIILDLLESDKKVPKIKIKPSKSSKLNSQQKTMFEKSRSLLLEKSREYQIRPEIIINQADLRSLILGNLKLKKVLFGWRYKVFGKSLANL